MELPSQHKTIRKLRTKSYETNNVSLTIALDHCLERVSVLGGHIEPNNLTEFRRLRLEFGETNTAKLQGWVPEKRALHTEQAPKTCRGVLASLQLNSELFMNQ